jgi:tRNA threonylcarbamoyladenosine biosynthesis protein TsaB
MTHGQAEALLPMVDGAMREAGLTVATIELVAVTTGPGSFTGIRVGLAAARGIALAGGFPLLGVTSFEAAAAAVAENIPSGYSILVAIESRRADLYVQLLERPFHPLSEPAAILPERLTAAVAAAVGARPFAITGDAAVRAAGTLAGRAGVIVVEDASWPALGVAKAALRRWREGERGGHASPLYLRPPDVTMAGGWRPPRER